MVVIGFQAPILHKIDIDHTLIQFFELLLTNQWLVDIYSFFDFLQNTAFFKIAITNPFLDPYRNGVMIPRADGLICMTHHQHVRISKLYSAIPTVTGF